MFLLRRSSLPTVRKNYTCSRVIRILLLVIISSALSLLTFLAVSSAESIEQESSVGRKTEFYKGRQVAAGEVLVKFSQIAGTAAVTRAKQDADVDFDEGVGGLGVRLFRSRSKNTEALVQQLSQRADVVYAEPNHIIQLTATPNDPQYSELYGLHNINNTSADIDAQLAWDLSKGSRNNVVGVVDTGVDYNHPDLAANMWSAPTAFTVNIGGQPITCQAGTHGFNAITRSCDPMDDHSHGTHVAGTIGAVGNNGTGVVGINWTASMMAIKMMDATGNGTEADAVNGIEFAIQAKTAFAATGGANVRVLSNSWGGGGFSQTLLNEINRANSNELLFVAAAGNSGANNDSTAFYPANYNAPNVIAVAATDYNDNLAGFSNYGVTKVHLGAPGVGTLSTTPNNSYGYKSGTSMATPHVSGAAALILSGCSLSTANLKSIILGNTDFIPSLAVKSITGGRLNVDKALRACAAPPSPTPSPTPTPLPSPTPTPSPGADIVWVEDTTPAGATLAGDSEGWNWVSNNPVPYSGTLASQSNIVSGVHQHYFYGASDTLAVNTGEILIAYVYLDPNNPPSEVMLQWNDGGWEHRAYWGANIIEWGADGTNGRRYMGPLPIAGQWVRLEVPASQVGVEGTTLNGMAFTLMGGRATWDHAGKSSQP